MPAFSHLYRYQKERNAMMDYTLAAKELGMLNWVGMGENDVIGEILDTGIQTVRVIKPYADRDKIFDQIAFPRSTAHSPSGWILTTFSETTGSMMLYSVN